MTQNTPFILVVDDDQTIQNFVYEGLSAEGYICEVASCADDALDKFEKSVFNLVLLDIRLPGTYGIDLLETIERKYQDTAVIMISGIEDIDIVVKSMNLGALDYILKPFTITKLTNSISKILINSRSFQDKSETNLNTLESKRGGKAIDPLLSEMYAIAYGVDVQIDYFDFHSKKVSQTTIDLAQRLGIPKEGIIKWANMRDKVLSERDEKLNILQKKLEDNPIAQIIMHLTNSLKYITDNNEEYN